MIPLSVTQVTYPRGPETLSDLAAETGAATVSVPEAVRGVDLVVVTIRHVEYPRYFQRAGLKRYGSELGIAC